MIENADYFVRLIEMPKGIRGMVSPNPDSTWNIYLNVKLGRESQLKSLKHELDHIMNNDFYNGESIAKIEGVYVLL